MSMMRVYATRSTIDVVMMVIPGNMMLFAASTRDDVVRYIKELSRNQGSR